MTRFMALAIGSVWLIITPALAQEAAKLEEEGKGMPLSSQYILSVYVNATEFGFVAGLEFFDDCARLDPNAKENFADKIVQDLSSKDGKCRDEAVKCIAVHASLIRGIAASQGDLGDDVVTAAFGRRVPAIKSALESILKHADTGESVRAAGALLAMDASHAAATEFLVKGLRATQKERRLEVCSIAEMVRPGNKEIVGELANIVAHDKQDKVRVAAARALAMIGPRAKSAVPALIAFLKEGDKAFGELELSLPMLVPAHSNAALLALGEIGPDAASAVSAIVTMLDKTKDKVETLQCLIKIGPQASTSVPALRRQFEAAQDNERLTLAAVLLCLDPDDATTMRVIKTALAAGPSKDAAFVLKLFQDGICPRTKSLVPLLVPFINCNRLDAGTYFDYTYAAVCVLEKMGPLAEPAIPDLVQLLTVEREGGYNFTHHVRAAMALSTMGKAGLPHLVKMVENKKHRHRHYAALALGRLGKDATPALPALIRMLEEDVDYSAYAAASLGQLRSIAAKARTALEAASKKGNTNASWALTQLGR
jgi:HEAT repeat protein